MPAELDVAPGVPFQTFRTNRYVWILRWNSRAGAWYLDVLDDDESPIRVGIRVVLGTALGRRCVDARFPPGVLYAVDTSGARREATLDDLGTRVKLYFYGGPEILMVSGAEPGEASEP